MDFDSFNADALAEVTAILGSCFIYKGTSYIGIINDLEVTRALEDGGLLEGLETIIVIQKACFPSAPLVGETIQTQGKTVRVERVKEDTFSYELQCRTAAV